MPLAFTQEDFLVFLKFNDVSELGGTQDSDRKMVQEESPPV